MSSFSLKLKHRMWKVKVERTSQLPPHFSSWQSWGQVDEENCPRASLSQEFKARTLDTSLVLFPGATCRALGKSLHSFSVQAWVTPSGLFPHPPGLPFLQASSCFTFSWYYSLQGYILLISLFFCQAFSASIIWLPLSLPIYIFYYILLMSFPQQACLTIFCFFSSKSTVTKLFS